MPAYNAVFSSDNTTTHGQIVTEFYEHMRLMSVEMGVITMITNETIPDMSEEEQSQLLTDLEEINDYRAEASLNLSTVDSVLLRSYQVLFH